MGSPQRAPRIRPETASLDSTWTPGDRSRDAVNPRDNDGRTPLDVATNTGNRDVAELLRSRGGEYVLAHAPRCAVDALVSIGEPAVEHLIAAINDGTWQARRYAAMALGEIRITPLESPVRIGSAISSEDPRAVARLLTGLKRGDSAALVGACRFFIRRGEVGSEAALIQALNAKGTKIPSVCS